MARGVHGGQAEGLPLFFAVQPGDLGSHGIDLAVVRRFHVEQGVAEDAVLVGHGVDMALDGDVPQGGVGLDIVHDGRTVEGDGTAVFPGDDAAEFGHGGGHHIAQLLRGRGQLRVRIGAGGAFIEHVDGDDGGPVLRIGGQLFQGVGHEGPVIGAIGAQLGQRLLVDADDDDFRGGGSPLLEQPVLHPPVQPVQPAGRDEGQDQQGGQEGEQVFAQRGDFRFHG